MIYYAIFRESAMIPHLHAINWETHKFIHHIKYHVSEGALFRRKAIDCLFEMRLWFAFRLLHVHIHIHVHVRNERHLAKIQFKYTQHNATETMIIT